MNGSWSPVAIGLDVGGTSLKGGLVTEDGALVTARRLEVKSGGKARDLLQGFGALLKQLWIQAPQPVSGIGVGMPGPFDYEKGISYIQGLQKYDALYGLNLKEVWREQLGLPAEFPIRFINDAAAFALGEVRYGAAKGYKRMLVITLGTGCGSAFIVDGRLVTEGKGVPQHGYVYNLRLRDTPLDDLLSRRGILKLWEEVHPQNQALSRLDVKDIAIAAQAGDVAARTVFVRFGALVAEGLGPVLAAFQPEALILGGQITKSFACFAPSLAASLTGMRLSLPVIPAADLETGGVRGAASLVYSPAGGEGH